jgi:hypothetical protein
MHLFFNSAPPLLEFIFLMALDTAPQISIPDCSLQTTVTGRRGKRHLEVQKIMASLTKIQNSYEMEY